MEYLKVFRKHHNIDKKANLSDIQAAVNCVYEANKIGFEFISNIDNKIEKDGFILHTHLNIYGRIFEQVEGMLVCVATQCPTGSEALGRTVIEGSVNLMYMSGLGNEKTIIAFFDSWINGHKRKLSEWKEAIKDKDYFQNVEPMIDERLKFVESYRDFVNSFVINFDIDRKDNSLVWPKSLYKRFEALGLEGFYYENYHRLSGASHLTAEDTIAWLTILGSEQDVKNSHSRVAWAYSVMMSRLSCMFFLDATLMMCISHGMGKGNEMDRISELKGKLSIAVEQISKEAGVPQV